MSQDFNDFADDSIDLGKLFRIVLMQTKLIVLILVVTFLLWLAYFLSAERQYSVESILQVEGSTMRSPEDVTSALMGGDSGAELEEYIHLYNTRTNVLKLIEQLSLNAVYEDWQQKSLVQVKHLNFKSHRSQEPVGLAIEASPEAYNLLDESGQVLIEQGQYGQLISSETIDIQLDAGDLEPGEREEIALQYYRPAALIDPYVERFQVTQLITKKSFMSKGGLIKISLVTPDVEQGIDIINTANQIFIAKHLTNNSEKATRAITFIDERLDTLEAILEQDQTRLNQFQQSNNSVNVDLEIQSILETLSEVQDQLTQVQLEEAKISAKYTLSHPIYENLQTQKQVLVSQQEAIQNKINQLPKAQQEYIDLFRDVEISQQLYSELLNKKLSFSIMEASTIGNIRVVDDAYEKALISPRLVSFILSMFLGGFIGLVVGLIRGLYFTPLSNPAEIMDGGIDVPMLGVFPLLEQTDHYQQSMETLIVNVRLLENDSPPEHAKVLLVTSPSAENGKSLTSCGLARKLAELDYRVLLMDTDLKRGDQHKAFGKETIETAVIEQANRQNIEQFKVQDNLYFVPRIKKLRETFGWLNSASFKAFINNVAKPEFDYIIIDTAPLLSVSDTFLLVEHADHCILMARHGLTKIRELKQSVEVMQQVGREFCGIIYNSFEKPKGYFGYYQYYGNYSYKYYADKYLYDAYDYQKD
jgi:tyrosine-protein kinase Etk/Wzc